MITKNIMDEIEAVLIAELGVGSSYIFQQKLKEMGLTKNTVKKPHIEKFISNVLREYDKILGAHIKIIEKELKNKFNVNINH